MIMIRFYAMAFHFSKNGVLSRKSKRLSEEIYGTDHTCLGIAENSDAIAIVVSEETGIISMAKNDSNFGSRVSSASTLPIHLMMAGRTPIYVRMSKSGTTKRIGSRTDVKKFICGTCTQSGKANEMPS